MKKIFLFILIFISIRNFAQIPDSSWLTPYTIENTPLQLLRAPADKLGARAKNEIISIQRQLDRCKAEYEAGKQTYKSFIESDIEYVANQIPDWPVAYYQKELDAYLAYNKVWNTRDMEGIHTKLDRQQDSLLTDARTAGYCFVSVASTLMTEKPWGRGMAIATFRKGSYLKLPADDYNSSDTASYIHVSAESMDGYVRKSDIVDKLDKLVLDAAKTEIVNAARYYDYTKTAAYKAKEQKEAAVLAAAEARQAAADARETAAADAREAKARRAKYHWGLKGGCYFINSNGKKEYVSDKSLCQ